MINRNDTLLDVTDPAIDYAADGAAGGPAVNHRVLSSLRGRYPWAVISGLLFASLGAVAGYMLWKPQYQSTAIIEVIPSLPKILYETEQSTPLAMYDGFINTQMGLLESHRVMQLVMETPEWQGLGRVATDDKVVEAFREGLSVSRERGSQIITVSVVDEDQRVPKVVADAVVDQYLKVFGEESSQQQGFTEKYVREELDRLNREIVSTKRQINEWAKEYGSDSLVEAYQQKLTELFSIEDQQRDVQFELLIADSQLGVDKPQESNSTDESSAQSAENGQIVGPADDAGVLTEADELANEELREAQTQLGRLERTLQPGHPRLEEAQKRVDDVREMITRRAEAAAQSALGNSRLLPGSSAILSPEKQIALLKARWGKLKELYDKTKGELVLLGNDNRKIEEAKSNLEGLTARAKEAQYRFDALSLETKVGGRIRKIAEGNNPGNPVNLKKRKQLAVLGGMGGLTFGVGIIVLWGLMDRRYRYVADAQDSIGSLPLLGVLPQLPGSLEDPEQASIAAHAVQQIRVQLQLGQTGKPYRTLAITSAMPGEGKTSLAMALGLSYAAAGYRTLLVDFDLYGQGLTTHSECIVRPKLGPMLLKEGLITVEQLGHALDRATATRKKLGETLVAMGVITETDLRKSLARQAESTIGLRDVILRGQEIDQAVHVTDDPQLMILPAGQASPDWVANLSPTTVAAFFEKLRHLYDAVIVDTGPIPASTEASLVASQVDGVIVTASRGIDRRAAERTMRHLAGIGAHIAGVVFNRAKQDDMNHSGYSPGAGSRMSRSSAPRQLDLRPGERMIANSNRFGPVAHAAALALPCMDIEDGKHRGDADHRGDAEAAEENGKGL